MIDDRIMCVDCAKLRVHKHTLCMAAAKREREDVGERYGPIADIPFRCEWFQPKPGDPDQRTGAQRWPTLMDDYRKRMTDAKNHQTGRT